MATYALITGASRGIGRSLAKVMAEKGHNLLLVARDKEALESIAKELREKYSISVQVFARDLAIPEHLEDIKHWVELAAPELHIVVNNAGFGLFGSYLETSHKKEQTMIHVNMSALTEISKFALQKFSKQEHGYLLNVASIAAFVPGPLMAVYFATKAYVLSFSEALASEFENTHIHVATLCPGPTETDFEKNAEATTSRLFKNGLMSPDDVAAYAYKKLFTGQRVIIPGWKNKLLVIFSKILPRRFLATLVKKSLL